MPLKFTKNQSLILEIFFYNPEKYARRINKFLKMVLNGSITKEPREIVLEDKNEEPVRSGSAKGV